MTWTMIVTNFKCNFVGVLYGGIRTSLFLFTSKRQGIVINNKYASNPESLGILPADIDPTAV